MKNVLKLTIQLLLTSLLFCLAACGGGGGETPAAKEQAMITLTLAGGSGTLGALQFDLVLPDGFTLATDAQGQLINGVVTTSLTGVMVDDNYLPANAVNKGQLTLALISSSGFQAGASVILKRDLAAGEILPLGTDFIVNNLLVYDINGVQLSGYSIHVDVQRLAP